MGYREPGFEPAGTHGSCAPRTSGGSAAEASCRRLRALLAGLLLCLPGALGAEEKKKDEKSVDSAPVAEVTATRRVAIQEDGRELHVEARDAGGEVLLVGVIVGGKETGSIEVRRRDGRFQVPLEDFAGLSGIEVVDAGHSVRLETPLGAVELGEHELTEIGGVIHLGEGVLTERLATPISFNAEQFALVFDLPWRPDTDASNAPDSEASPAPPEPEVDAHPPSSSLSTIRIDAGTTLREHTQNSNSSTTLGGRLAAGFWRLRYEDDLAGRGELRDYSWLRTAGRVRYLVGHQRPSVHPLLESLELTGLQVAVTNQPRQLFSTAPELGELFSRRLQPLTSVRGSGPAAGFAELRIDDEVVEVQRIGLDGLYEFLDIPLQSRRLSRVEVRLFDRRDLSVPVAVHERTQSASDLLLTPGAQMLLAGAGRAGNLLVDEDGSGRGVGFLQWRHGFSDRLTVEAAAQQASHSRRAMAGLITRLGDDTVVSFSAARSEDGLGYDFALEKLRGRWRLLAQSRWLQEGFLAAGAEEIYSHDLEIGYRSRRLDLALLGRAGLDADREQSHLLPAIAWRATDRFFLRARPDRLGEYRYDLTYRFGARARLGFSYQDHLSADFTYRLRERSYLTLDAELGDDRADRYSAILRGFGAGRRERSWSAGLIYTEGGSELGYLLALTGDLRDGLRARIELSNPDGSRDGHQLSVGLTANLALARGRLLSGRRRAVRDDRGAVAGRVRPELPPGFPDYFLGDFKIFVDGRLATRTEPDGTFFVGHLEEGLHRLELDPENLPIELVPRRLVLHARVASAAVTRVDFELVPELGVAGRVTTSSGGFLPGVELEALDPSGVAVARAHTDRFGYYRLDGLPPGTYVLRPAGASSDAPRRTFEIRGDFLFGIDLQLDPNFLEH